MLSVIIVNYYSADLTAQAAKSVLEDYVSAQVIVIDNSTNETEYMKLKMALPARVECFAMSENIGFGRACNAGAEKCRNEYIFLLNPDTKIIKGCILKLTEALRANNRLGAVSPQSFWDDTLQFFLPPGQLQTPLWELLNALGYRWTWYRKRFSQQFRQYALSIITAQTPVKQRMISGGHLLITKTTIKKLGYLFDESFFFYYEDTDLSLRIHKLGLQLSLVPEAKVVHFWRNDPNKAKFSTLSRNIYMQKHFSRSIVGKIKVIIESLPITAPEDYVDIGTISAPPTFEIDNELAINWVLEISVNPLLIPSAIHIGSGTSCFVPENIWRLLGNGEYWARIGNENKGLKVFKWIIE